jgi:hypothetical protein
MKLRTISIALAVAALGGTLLAAPSAHAVQARYTDPADATASLTDIRAVAVNHGPNRLIVSVRFTDLQRRSTGGGSGLTVGIDTRGDRAGPEFRLTTGLQEGTDYQLMRVRNGRAFGEALTCPHRLQLDFAAERLTFVAARTCLGTPARIRVAVLMRDQWDASHPVTDWLGAPRSYTPWQRSA